MTDKEIKLEAESVKKLKHVEEKENMSAPPVIVKPTATVPEQPKCAPEMPILSNPLKRTAMEALLNVSFDLRTFICCKF